MSIIFFGTPVFAVPTLRRLISSGEEIQLVVTQPDRVGGRGHKMLPPPVKIEAERNNLRVVQPESIKNGDIVELIKQIRPEFIVVVAYGKILPSEVLNAAEKGCINVHASLLPKYRGAAPIQWALINCEEITGVTTMFMNEGLDTGDVLLQKEVVIKESDNALTLSERLSEIGADLLVETLSGVRSDVVRPRPQTGEPSYAPLLKKEDGLIDWSLSARQIWCRTRGLYPWPCAYTYYRGRLLKLIKVIPLEGEATPGVVAERTKKDLIVGTGKGLIKLLEVQPEGKKAMDINAFLQGQGRDIGVGERLG